MAKYPMQFNDEDVKSGAINVGPDGCLRSSKLIRVKHTPTNSKMVTEGSPVRISGNHTVSPCTSGNEIAGVVTKVLSDSECLIVTQGEIVTLPYTGSTVPSRGFCALEANGSDGVKAGETSVRERVVLAVDTENATVTFVL